MTFRCKNTKMSYLYHVVALTLLYLLVLVWGVSRKCKRGFWQCTKHAPILAIPLLTCKNVTLIFRISHDYIILSTFKRKKIESSLVAHYIRHLKHTRMSTGKFNHGRLKVYFNISENMEKCKVCERGSCHRITK